MKFRKIRQAVLIDAGPIDVYEAYVDPRKHGDFTGSPATGTQRAGSAFTAWDGYIMGKYLKLERGKRITHEWTTTEWPEGYPPSLVELTLTAKGKKTILSMVHSRVPPEQAESYAQGWKEWYWEPMKKYFAKE